MSQSIKHSFLNLKLLTVLVALSAVPCVAGAQNLVQNAEFDFDVARWTPKDDVEIEFRNNTGSTLPGGSGPGSLEVRYFYWNGGSGGPFQEIFGINEGATYTLSGSRFLPSEDNVATSANIFVNWLDAAGDSLGRDWAFIGSIEYDTWERASDTFVAPGHAVRANISVTVGNPADTEETRPGVVLWDDIWFSEEGTGEAVQALFVPAAASVNGLGGTFWSTTGWFSNAVDLPVTLWGAFLPPGEDNTAKLSNLMKLATIPGNGFAKLEDIVGLLGESQVAGGLYLEARATGSGLPARLVTVTTHTFTPNPEGEGVFGQGLPAAGPGTMNEVMIPGLFKNSRQRTNIGLLNTSTHTLDVVVEIWDDSGAKIAAQGWTLPPYSQRQSSLASIGVGSLDGGTAIIFRQSNFGSFLAYTSTVDQESGDAVYNPGQ